jgi:hypothetical protein
MADANIKPRLGSPDVDKLKTREIELWLNELAEITRRKPRGEEEVDSPEAERRRKDTANRNLTVLKVALTYALREKRISCDGSASLVMPFKNVGQARTGFLSDAEARRVVQNCSDPAFRLLGTRGPADRLHELPSIGRDIASLYKEALNKSDLHSQLG